MPQGFRDEEHFPGGTRKDASDEEYFAALSSFYSALVNAVALSHAAGGRQGGERCYWASVLFTKLCTTACSVVALCPRNPFSHPDRDHWDMSAVASLSRNLFECSFALYYMAFEEVDEDEWLTRLNVMQLHDCMTRLKMFRDLDPEDKTLATFAAQADDLRGRLLGRKHFSSLPDKQRKRFLTGDHAWLLTQDELMDRMGEVPDGISSFRGLYRYISTHAHSYPVAFYRMFESGSGRGLENPKEKGLITFVLLPQCEGVIRDDTKRFNALFPDINIAEELASVAKRYGKRSLRRRTTIK